MRRAGWILLITCLGYCADNAQRPLPHCSLPTWLPHCSCVVVAVCGSSLALAAALLMRSSAFALAIDTTCPRLASSRQRFLPHLHANHHRNLWLRSHPAHLASPAPCSPPLPTSVEPNAQACSLPSTIGSRCCLYSP